MKILLLRLFYICQTMYMSVVVFNLLMSLDIPFVCSTILGQILLATALVQGYRSSVLLFAIPAMHNGIAGRDVV